MALKSHLVQGCAPAWGRFCTVCAQRGRSAQQYVSVPATTLKTTHHPGSYVPGKTSGFRQQSGIVIVS